MNVCLDAELLEEVKPSDAGFPLWLVIVLILSSLSVIVLSLIVFLRCLTAATPAEVKGSTFTRMESGNDSWSLPRPERHVWSNSHLDYSLPPFQHTVINMPTVSLSPSLSLVRRSK